MKVSEMISKLFKLPLDAEVCMEDWAPGDPDFGATPVLSVDLVDTFVERHGTPQGISKMVLLRSEARDGG